MQFLKGLVLFTLIVPSLFAKISDCQNLKEISLGKGVSMKFCDIPAATNILIGNPTAGVFDTAKPVKARNFKSFSMGQFEVTQLQYKTIMKEEPWIENGQVLRDAIASDNTPAIYVSHLHAEQFAKILSFMDPTATYRLPTEAEWEYAARGTTTTPYYFGEKFDADYVYGWKNAKADKVMHARNVFTCPNKTMDALNPGYCANGYGLMHMLGNVREWTADVFSNSYLNASLDGNEIFSGPTNNAPEFRMQRGGSWLDIPRFSTVTYRSGSCRFNEITECPYRTFGRIPGLGFRLVRIAR